MDGHYVGIDIEQCDLSQEVIPLETNQLIFAYQWHL